MANQLMERAVALNGGNATIYARWISLLEAMSWHGKALVLKFFLAEAYQEQVGVGGGVVWGGWGGPGAA